MVTVTDVLVFPAEQEQDAVLAERLATVLVRIVHGPGHRATTGSGSLL